MTIPYSQCYIAPCTIIQRQISRRPQHFALTTVACKTHPVEWMLCRLQRQKFCYSHSSILLVFVGEVLQMYILRWIGLFAMPVWSLNIQRGDCRVQGRRIVEEIVVTLSCDSKCLCGVLKMVQELYLLTYSLHAAQPYLRS